MRTPKTMLAGAALVLVASSVYGQANPPQQPSPEQMKQIFQSSMQATMGAMTAAMTTAMGPMTEAVIEAELNIAAKAETAERIATFKRNLYDALIKKGFKEPEALQIVVVTSLPSASPSAK